MRKLLPPALILLLLGAVAAAVAWMRPPTPRPETSFVVIVIDSLRADHVSAYGHKRPTTPRIDGLAARGILFTRAYAQAPWTKPSVASIFTSTYISVHRVLYSGVVVDGEKRSDVLSEKFVTLAEAMHAGGYATGGFGQKIHLRPKFGFDQGFEGYDMGAKRAEKINRAALEWLDRADPDRFFLYLHYNDPHYPYLPRPGYDRFGSQPPRVQVTGDTKRAFRAGELDLTGEDARLLREAYDGEIFYTDEMVGDLIDALEARGYENLVVIVTADHGEEFLDHGDITHGQSLYEELVRVPFIVSGSGLPPASRGTRTDALVELIDVMPTLLDLAGLPHPPLLQGVSLAPRIRGLGDRPAREAVFSERREPDETRFWRMAFDGRWKLLEDPGAPGPILFDLDADPGERERIQDRRPEVAGPLAARIDAWSETARLLHDRIRPGDSTPLDPETERRLRSLGYIN